MSDLFQFVINGDSISMFKVEDDGTEPVHLRQNQALTFDAATGDITLKSTFADHIALGLFQQTPDTTDDASLYVGAGLSFTTLDGTPVRPGDGAHGGPGGDTPGSVSDDQDLDGNPNDVIRAGDQGGDHHGGGGDDQVEGGRGNDNLFGDDGNDHLSGGRGDDDLNGGIGNDSLQGGTGNDTLSGDDGNDTEQGGAGTDHVSGGAGNDVVGGGSGADTVSGDDGNDKVAGGAGNDVASGGAGNDKVDGGLGDDQVSGDAGNDLLLGRDGSDTLSGGDGNDREQGGIGDDHLAGDAGNDKLDGGAGNDTLDGGAGRDVMHGGLGADTFVFTADSFASATGKGADLILDFSHAQGDHIDLSAVDADLGTDGDQAFSFIGTADFSNTAGELRYEVKGDHAFVSGDQNGDGVADFTIRLADVTSLDVTDFVL
ncbi:hypothetical protein AQZ52_06625 [Novosphingobium fuchskuhlense]|uniref:Peptidase M10 serralysin C-terminal domain-containing protein n=1 Tax=Novosphingobium fuchskuhlense TaxID=1117702 RepID=A0A124JW20_9SPHN|nr:calcium-binding protein [Novosphingobium fuchskuhlense]KUR72877.1 hypothetical protein AQZ52_06625 [Novosphingobium fuchskuhlense]